MRGSVFTISGYNVIGFTVLLHERENAIDASVQPHILTAYSHDTLGADMARTLYRRAIWVLLALLFTSGCASWHDERRSDAGYLSDGGTGGGWNTIDAMSAPY